MLIGVASFLLLLLALLAIPAAMSYQVSWHKTLHGTIRLSWLFGLIRIPIPLSQPKTSTPLMGKKADKLKGTRHISNNKMNVFSTIRNKPFRRRITRFVRELWRAIKKRNVTLRLRIGLGDPADTGQLWAVLGPLSGILANTRDATIELEPDFFDTTFELDSSGDIRIIPLQIIYLTLELLLSPPVRQVLKQARKD